MRRVIIILGVLLLAVPAAQAENVGSTFGLLWTARPLAQGHTAVGARVGVADATSFIGTFGYGFSRTGEGRLKVGVIDDEAIETELALGADLKWQLLDVWNVGTNGQQVRSQNPFDLAIGPFVEWFKADVNDPLVSVSQSVLEVGVNTIISYPVLLKGGGSISPYGRINARYESINAEIDMGPTLGTVDASENQLALGMNAGLVWHPRASAVGLYGEFQIDGNDGVFFGMDYTF